MKILVLNCGSSSIKFQILEMRDESVLAKGVVENIGEEMSRMKYEAQGKPRHIYTEIIANARVAMDLIIEEILSPQYGVLRSLDQIAGVGHRVVNGGEKYHSSAVINEDVIEYLIQHYELAPLHNPASVAGIHACREELPGTPMVAVFDTAFHQSMRREAYLYGLPYEYYEKYQMRRYGFHGTSHKYVAHKAAELMGRPFNELKIITCHLGSGASVTAIKHGVSIDTSMGFSPLSGLMMGTRSGDVDPSVITFLMEKENLTAKEVIEIMNKKSGLLGISGLSNDVRSLKVASERGNEMAFLSVRMFARRVKGFIGNYIAMLNGVDAIVFTAGIGENDFLIRSLICKKMDYLGIIMDEEVNKNKEMKMNFDVSAPESKARIFVIETNEELEIARETFAQIRKNYSSGGDSLSLNETESIYES